MRSIASKCLPALSILAACEQGSETPAPTLVLNWNPATNVYINLRLAYPPLPRGAFCTHHDSYDTVTLSRPNCTMRSFPLLLALAAIAQSAPVHNADRRPFVCHRRPIELCG